jgi:hypothetical protein
VTALFKVGEVYTIVISGGAHSPLKFVSCEVLAREGSLIKVKYENRILIVNTASGQFMYAEMLKK